MAPQSELYPVHYVPGSSKMRNKWGHRTFDKVLCQSCDDWRPYTGAKFTSRRWICRKCLELFSEKGSNI